MTALQALQAQAKGILLILLVFQMGTIITYGVGNNKNGSPVCLCIWHLNLKLRGGIKCR